MGGLVLFLSVLASGLFMFTVMGLSLAAAKAVAKKEGQ